MSPCSPGPSCLAIPPSDGSAGSTCENMDSGSSIALKRTRTLPPESSLIMSPAGWKSKHTSDEGEFQTRIVQLILLKKNPEGAIEELSKHFGVDKPDLRMGLPKGEKKALGCYVHREKTIYIADRDHLYDPYVIIHEFYHHLRHASASGKHRGTERHAREFALTFLRSSGM